jgi:hypothetical protein
MGHEVTGPVWVTMLSQGSKVTQASHTASQGKSKVRWQCHSEERSDEESLRLSPSARETLRYAQGDIASSIRKNATFDKPWGAKKVD